MALADEAAKVEPFGGDGTARASPSPRVPLPSTLKTTAGWGLGRSLSDEGNLAFFCLIVFLLWGVPVFFLLPLPGSLDLPPISDLPSCSVWSV